MSGLGKGPGACTPDAARRCLLEGVISGVCVRISCLDRKKEYIREPVTINQLRLHYYDCKQLLFARLGNYFSFFPSHVAKAPI